MIGLMKTRWLLPILVVGLAVLTIEPLTPTSDQSLADAAPATEATASGLEPATGKAETPEVTQAALDGATLGTY